MCSLASFLTIQGFSFKLGRFLASQGFLATPPASAFRFEIKTMKCNALRRSEGKKGQSPFSTSSGPFEITSGQGWPQADSCNFDFLAVALSQLTYTPSPKNENR
ncbi:MAG TPA: hypothetical protein VK395_24165 [Gemmataceae bacterium]|nr:hypothetical protein [Gemmataceae bacterium]